MIITEDVEVLLMEVGGRGEIDQPILILMKVALGFLLRLGLGGNYG